MSSSDIKKLLQPPNINQSHARAKDDINSRFTSIEALDELETLVIEFQHRQQELTERVSIVTFTLSLLWVSVNAKIRLQTLKQTWTRL